MFDRSSLARAADHLRYLYAENGRSMMQWAVLLVPSGVLTLALFWIGYQASVQLLGPIFSAAISAVMVVLAVLAFSEAAPVLPIQVVEWRERMNPRNKMWSGWAYIILAVGMGWLFFSQLNTMWHRELAGKIWMMPEVLSLLGVLALFIVSIAVSYHRLPLQIHNNIMEYEQASTFSKNYRILRKNYGIFVGELMKRIREQRVLDPKEVERWSPIFVATERQLSSIENHIYSDLMEGE